MAKEKIHVSSPEETREWLEQLRLRKNEKELLDLFDIICQAWHDYEGQCDVIESAIGALILGRLVGYDGLRVVHSWKTLRNYEEILGVAFKDLPERTADSRRVNGIRYAEKFKKFWKALAGGIASEPGARELVKA